MKKIITILFLLIMMVSVVYAIPNYKVEIVDTFSNPTDNFEEGGERVKISVEIINVGSDGEMNIECGIYTQATLIDWGVKSSLFSFLMPNVDEVTNCVSGQDNVFTASVGLDSGESMIVPFFPIAPNTNPDTKYAMSCTAYRECWSASYDGPEPRVTDSDIAAFDLLETEEDYAETCFDGIQNQGESSTDCGEVCDSDNKLCIIGLECDSNNDCESNNCESGRCISSVPGVTPGVTPGVNPPGEDDNNENIIKWSMIGGAIFIFLLLSGLLLWGLMKK